MPETTSRYNRDTFSAFRILPWALDAEARTIMLRYALDDVHHFAEMVTLPSALWSGALGAASAADTNLAGIIDLLAVVAGVSYFKVAAPRRVEVAFPLSTAAQSMAAHAYDDGMREFAYRGGLAVPLAAEWGVETRRDMRRATGEIREGCLRPLLPMGGGRDSALLASILAPLDPILTVHGENRFIDRLGAVLGRPVHRVARTLDPSLFELNNGPALNGHVPVTAINSLIGVVTASLAGATDVVMANERSASAASLMTADGDSVNHQYSKSYEFEVLLGEAVASVGGPGYFSGLRPWSELAISKAFAGRPELYAAIMSCNRAFLRDPAKRSDGWCGHCDKCRFVYLTLSPFMDGGDLVAMFGRDLFADPANSAGFAALMDDDQRPWDCVGEPSEARLAMRLLAPAVALCIGTGTGCAGGDTDMAGGLSEQLEEGLRPSSEHRLPAGYRDIIFGAMAESERA